MNALYFSFLQGMLAFLAPCAVALLPGYIASFISRGKTTYQPLFYRATKLAILIILGILIIYAGAGIFIVLASHILKAYLKWIAISMGIGVLILGSLMAMGKNISLSLQVKHRTFTSENLEALFFGFAYAIGALGCLFPLFLVVVTQAIAEPTILGTASHIIAYFLGMSLLMIGTIILAVIAKRSLQKNLHKILPHVERISGALLIIAGIYIITYQWALV